MERKYFPGLSVFLIIMNKEAAPDIPNGEQMRGESSKGMKTKEK